MREWLKPRRKLGVGDGGESWGGGAHGGALYGATV